MPRARKILFQSTLPVRGGTLTRLAEVFEQEISIHPPRAGRDNRILKALAYINDFNPPSPCGEGLFLLAGLSRSSDFNPPSPCGEGPDQVPCTPLILRISIHPPRAGRDSIGRSSLHFSPISIHPPRAGRDAATICRREDPPLISIHPPRAGRDDDPVRLQSVLPLISIHPPRAGRDRRRSFLRPLFQEFQSTLPVRGGTRRVREVSP